MNKQETSRRGPEDFTRAADQSSRILTRLQEAGSRGVTNAEMWALGAHAAHSRIADLRKRGYEISCKRESPGTWRYRLVSSDNKPEPLSDFMKLRCEEEARENPLFAGVRHA